MDAAEIEDLFAGLGPVTVRRMFGGKGVYHRGAIIAVEVGGQMLLKADAETSTEFERAGSKQWSYEGKQGKAVLMPYWTIPDEALDDPERMAQWARLAYAAGLRTTSAKSSGAAQSRAKRSTSLRKSPPGL